MFASQEPEMIQIFINTRKKTSRFTDRMLSVFETERSFICIVILKTLCCTVVKIASLTSISCRTNFARNKEQKKNKKRFQQTLYASFPPSQRHETSHENKNTLDVLLRGSSLQMTQTSITICQSTFNTIYISFCYFIALKHPWETIFDDMIEP